MRRLLIGFFALLAFAGTAFAAELDEAYIKAFGRGTIMVAQTGFPAKLQYDPSMFDYKDGVFRIPAGDAASLNVRAILPAGITLGQALEKLKKERGENLNYHRRDFCAYRVWSSHDGDTNLVNEKHPWPKKLGDVPTWASPKVGMTELTSDVYDWTAPGAVYEGDFAIEFLGWLNNIKAGAKLYISFHVCYEYQTPGGATESKWNSVLGRFEQVISNGELGYVYSDPLCAVTVELK